MVPPLPRNFTNRCPKMTPYLKAEMPFFHKKPSFFLGNPFIKFRQGCNLHICLEPQTISKKWIEMVKQPNFLCKDLKSANFNNHLQNGWPWGSRCLDFSTSNKSSQPASQSEAVARPFKNGNFFISSDLPSRKSNMAMEILNLSW